MDSLKYILCCFVSVVTIQTTIAQVVFNNATGKLPNSTFMSWLQKGVADINNDGLDDIVRANQQGFFYILKQQPNGGFVEEQIGQVQLTTPLSVILGDVDNNGYNDILTGGQYSGVRIVKLGVAGTGYRIDELPEDLIFTQASAMADINNDGWLDIFVCNDDSTNGIWRNTGGGNFERNSMGFDFSSVPLNRHSGNYGIVFTDFDNDGDLDAYLSKCSHLAPTDSTDLRRINQLFVNDGQNNFIDRASQYGLRDSSQTWITEFQDIDNDGDMDAFIANHHSPSRLMMNDGTGHFKDITANAGLLGNTPDGILQALMRDFDNDGYNDLIVSGMTKAAFYRNNGNRTFTETNLPLLFTNIDKPLRSFAVGDLNHDGFLDLYTSYYYGNTDPDQLWLNEKNKNHFIAIKLVGTKSNHSAIGARITIKSGNKIQIREVRAGESYGISNTLTQYFGLGTDSSIDKIEVRWPSGQESVITNPSLDQFLNITESSCSSALCIPITFKVVRL